MAAARLTQRIVPIFCALGSLAAAQSRAAGGHHAVDDAAMLEPGQCQIETWVDRERAAARTLWHAGPACRVGAVELGLNLDRHRFQSAATVTTAGVQLKWTQPIRDDLGAGIVAAAALRDGSPRYLGSALLLPVSWQVSNTLLAHANVGRDFWHRAPDTSRAGLALEWTPVSAWTLLAERFRDVGANQWRAGVRWHVSSTLDVDLSRAQGLHRWPPPWWTLGVAWMFDR